MAEGAGTPEAAPSSAPKKERVACPHCKKGRAPMKGVEMGFTAIITEKCTHCGGTGFEKRS